MAKGSRGPCVCSHPGKEHHRKTTAGYYSMYSFKCITMYLQHLIHGAYLEGVSVHLLLKHLILVKQSMKLNK